MFTFFKHFLTMALSERSISYTQRFVEAAEVIKREQNIKITSIMKSLELPEQYFTRYKAGTQSFPFEKIDLLCELYNLSKEWIVSGIGEMFKQKADEDLMDDFQEKMLFDLRHSLHQPIEVSLLKESYKILYDRYEKIKKEYYKIKTENKAKKELIKGALKEGRDANKLL